MARAAAAESRPVAPSQTIVEIATQFRGSRRPLREEWMRRIAAARMLSVLSAEELAIESIALVDTYIDVMETGTVEGMQAYARTLSRRIVPHKVETPELLGIVLVLRDVLARRLIDLSEGDPGRLDTMLAAFEPAAIRLATTLAENLRQEHERLIRRQQDAIRDLSAPVLEVRDRLLVHPIIGDVDRGRARRMTEQLLAGIRAHRAAAVVLDVSAATVIDAAVAHQLVQTVKAARLLGAAIIVTGLSPDVSRMFETIGVDLPSLRALGDLQDGIEEAEVLLGYRVVPLSDAPTAPAPL